MNEQSTTRAYGQDIARSGWQAAADRADTSRPDAVRTEATPAVRLPGPPLPGTPTPPDAAVNWSETKDAASDAIFPRSYARFKIDSETQRLSIKIVDAVTDEVIREIPPEQVKRIADDLQSIIRLGSHAKRAAPGADSDLAAGGGVDRYV